MKCTILLCLLIASFGHSAESKPKYGPEATLLSQSHDFVRKNPAPDYWAISPYYISQQDERSCSLASVTMIVNAARSGKKMGADERLATQPEVLKRAKSDLWTHALGPLGGGVTLDQLKPIVESSLKAYGVGGFTVKVLHADSEKASAEIHQVLVENEKSDRNFVIANFIQGVFTGDADVGHIAPVGAYDSKTKQVLIMDPDRQWYEPYWVSESTFLKGMATVDKASGQARGLVWIQLKK